jgi:hypothetical protein
MARISRALLDSTISRGISPSERACRINLPSNFRVVLSSTDAARNSPSRRLTPGAYWCIARMSR